MRILQASFHFGTSHEASSLVVAYVYCERSCVTIELVHSALEGTRPIIQLRQLVEQAGADACEKLIALRSPDWSFDLAPIH